MKEANLLGTAMDRLEAYKEQVDLNDAFPFITAIFDVGDDLPSRTPGAFFEIEPSMHAVRIIFWYLRREKEQTRKDDVLLRAVGETDGLFLPIEFVSLEDQKTEKDKDPSLILVTANALATLKTLCVQKIRIAAENGRLISHQGLAYILYRWREWAGTEEVRQWVSVVVKNPRNLVQCLRSMRQTASTMGSVRQTTWYNLKTVEDFATIDDLESVLATVEIGGLTTEEQDCIADFKKALARRKAGKPDIGIDGPPLLEQWEE